MAGTLDYKKLKQISVQAARVAVLEYLSSNGGNVSECARTFGIQRLTVYSLIKKQQEDNLGDRSKAPKKIANKTPQETVKKVIQAYQNTNLGPKALQQYLLKTHRLNIAYGTLRGILKNLKS